VREDLREVVSSAEGFRLHESGPRESYDLLIIEIGGDISKEFQFIRDIQASGKAREVFLTSSALNLIC